MKKLVGLMLATSLLLGACAPQVKQGSAGTIQAEESGAEASGASSAEQAPSTTHKAGNANSPLQETTTVSVQNAQAKEQIADGEIIEVREKMFIAQTDEIYTNYEDYLGKTIKLEGLFYSFAIGEGADSITDYYVLRQTPGCCGNDGSSGFRVVWDKEYPQQNDWVEAVGTLKVEDVDGMLDLYLELSSLQKLEKRGLEFVEQ